MPYFSEGYALVIGVANYANVRPLPETVLKDARDIAALLQQPDRAGYAPANVKMIIDRDATRQAIMDGLAWLANAAGAGATALVYYSGHGGHIDSGPTAGNYLIPVDTRLDALAATAISSDELTSALRAIHADRLVVLLDACHSGGAGDAKDIGLADTLVYKGGFGAEVYSQLAQGEGRAIFASSKSGELSYVLPNAANSLFTQTLLEALNGKCRQRGDGLLRLFDIVEYVWDEVPKRYSLQHPIFKAHDLDASFPIALYMGGQKDLAPTPLTTAVDRVKLRDLIVARKNLEDLELLCEEVENEMRNDGINLQFNLDIVGGQGKAVRVKRLIEYLENRGRVAYLVRAIRKEFPGEI